MRSIPQSLPLVGLVFGLVLVLGVPSFLAGSAHGEEEAAAAKASDVKAMRAQIGALQKQVEYLRSREDALTAYLLANDTRAASFQDYIKKARTQGFLNKAIPAESRTTLLLGLDGLAESMRAELPVRTRDDERMRKAADAATRKAGSAD